MVTYFILFFLVGLFSIKDVLRVNILERKAIDYLLLVTAIFFVGFRYECDNDYTNYVTIYLDTPLLFNIKDIFDFSMNHGIEFGYLLVCSIFRTIGLGPQSIFIFSATITFCFIFSVIKKNTKLTALSFFIFFAQYFMLPFTQIRFGIAAAISLYACSLLPTPKRKQYWIFILLACSFHFTALASIAVYFFFKIDWVNRPIYIYGILFISVLFMFIPFGDLLIKLMEVFFISKYSRLYSQFYNGSDIGNTIWISVISNIIITYPLVLFRKILSNNQVKINLFLSMSLAGIFLGSLVWHIGILYRFSAINTLIFCMIIPSYLFIIKLSSMRIMGYFLIIFYCLLKYINHMQYLSNYTLFVGISS